MKSYTDIEKAHLEFALNARLNEDRVQCVLKVVKHAVLVDDLQAEQSVQELIQRARVLRE